MTRSLGWCAFFLSAVVLEACSDVPVGSDGGGSRGDASPEVTPRDVAPDAITCSGANPAAQTCRKTANDCVPSSCSCAADGSWHCTADCPVNVPLCTDGGAPEVAPDATPEAKPDVAPDATPDATPDAMVDATTDATPDAATCSGANPAAQTCRKTANDCVPSSCSCAADGSLRCTADCRTNLPLCPDGGAPDLASDLASDVPGYPTDEQSCLKATNVSVCDSFAPNTSIASAAGGPLLAKIEALTDSCTASTCASACGSIVAFGRTGISAGSSCDFRVTSTDGRSLVVTLKVVANPSPSHMCCGYPLDGHGMWVAVDDLIFSPSPVVVDFSGDGGAGNIDGVAPKDSGDTGANPCAKCAATEVCVQSFDGVCGLGTISCRTVSETCRNKLSASGLKSCTAISECESEFCASPFRCVYDSPCPNEAPEVALHCYGP